MGWQGREGCDWDWDVTELKTANQTFKGNVLFKSRGFETRWLYSWTGYSQGSNWIKDGGWIMGLGPQDDAKKQWNGSSNRIPKKCKRNESEKPWTSSISSNSLYNFFMGHQSPKNILDLSASKSYCDPQCWWFGMQSLGPKQSFPRC